MNQTGECGAGLAKLVTMFPVKGVSEGIAAGLKSRWVGPGDDREAALARAVAEFPLSNTELLASVAQCRPPQSWYDEDHEGLY
jgi:hypothetical protein